MGQAVWTTWVEINPEVCKRLSIERMDLVTITSENGETLTLPALESPTVHPDAIAIAMGMGHTSFGRYAFDKGHNPMSLVAPNFQPESGELAWAGTTVNIAKTGQKGWVTTYDWRAYGTRELYEGQTTE
jgi:anaerobic selenocysteine-containing dehydrogenase